MRKLTTRQHSLLKHLAWVARTVPYGFSKNTLRSLIKHGLVEPVPPQRARDEGTGFIPTNRGFAAAESAKVDERVSAEVVRLYQAGFRHPKAVRRGDVIETASGMRGHYFTFDGGYVLQQDGMDQNGEPLVKWSMGSRIKKLRLIDLFALYRELRIWAPGFDPAHDTMHKLTEILDIDHQMEGDEYVVMTVRGLQAKIDLLEQEVARLRQEVNDLQW